MIVAIPLDDDQKICITLGRAPFMLFYNTETDQSTTLENPAASAHGGAGIQCAQFIVDNGADALITVRCGQNAADVFTAAQMRIFKGEGTDVATNLKLVQEEKLAPLTHFHAGFHNSQ
ncbi:MAG: NifB/NifX family molybdenum-iron cluster-binding protein [Eubacteriales bacterium]